MIPFSDTFAEILSLLQRPAPIELHSLRIIDIRRLFTFKIKIHILRTTFDPDLPFEKEEGEFKVQGERGSPVLTYPTMSNPNSTQEKNRREMQSTGQPRRKALCIGINYTHHEDHTHLRGSHNDAREMEKFLRECYGYKPRDIVVLIDDNDDSTRQPTRENIIKAMKALVKDAKPNDHLFFHYSGHGEQIKDEDGDESDRKDEAIHPVDYMMENGGKIVGHITDDEMHEVMVKPLPAGCRLTAILDSCHSGTGLDLPYVYSTKGGIKRTEPGCSVRRSSANVVSWSGCKDSEESADITDENSKVAFGAMCNAFMTVLRSNRDPSYKDLLVSIRNHLEKEGRPQQPQLSSSHEMDTTTTFVC